MKDTQIPTDKSPFLETEASGHLRSLLRSILGSVPDAMIVIDENGVILAFSHAAERLFGYRAENVTGRNVSMLMTASDRDHHDRYMDNYMKTGEKQIIGIGRIVQARRANGESFPVELKIGEARLHGRRLFTGYLRDLTEQQANAHRISEMQAELASFSRLSAVGTMASAMAHELNQPLTAVANYLEAARDLLETPDPETLGLVTDALNAATTQSVRAGQIVRRLRDYVSRGELELRPVDLRAVIAEAVSLAKIGLEGRLARVIERLDTDLPQVLADKIQLRQVLLNLVKNAIEALQDTENPQICIQAECQGKDRVRLTIRDNGPGFDLTEGHDPFNPFHSSKPGGMGLGLSICQTIIEAHGGRIDLLSEPDQGAAFQIVIDAAPGGPPA